MAVRMSVRKTRRLRALLGKHYGLPKGPDPQETAMEDVVMAALCEDAPATRARLALRKLIEEFGDWNELRVSLVSELAEVLESCGLKGNRAPMLKRILAKAIEEFYSFEFERLREVSREAQRAWFGEIEGLPGHMAAAILYRVYHYDRVVVTAGGARVLQRLGLVGEDTPQREVEKDLSAVVPARESHLIHRALHEHARKVCKKTNFDCTKCLLRAECATGKARIAALEEARAKAKAKTKAEASKKKARTRTRPGAKATKKKAPTKRKAAAAGKKPKP